MIKIFLQARRINWPPDETSLMAIFRQTELMFVAEIALRALGLMPVSGALGLAVRLVIGIR